MPVSASKLDELLSWVKPKQAQVVEKLPTHESKEDDVPADIDTILASTEKLLAVSKGLAEPDERDSLQFRRVHTTAQLLAERIHLDADRVMRNTMRRVAKQRNLNPVGVDHLGHYATGLIVGHPLSSPLEEINPIHLVEQARRITALGPGGIPSTDSVTSDAQSIHPSQFGFIASIETPESEKAGVDVRQAWGTKLGTDGKIYQKMLNRRSGQHEWVSPDMLHDKVVGLPD